MAEENLPAVRADRDVAAPRDTDSWKGMSQPTFWLAEQLADTEFVPKAMRGKTPAVAAAILYGREVGLPPMTSLNSVYVVEGSPTLSAETMRALVLAAGHELVFTVTTGSRCVVRGRRRGGSDWSEVEWTIDMARAAGLTGKNNWKNYPRRMLQARASSELCELVFPDVIAGFRSVEDVEDQADVNGPDAPATSSTVSRSGGTRKRAAAKKAAPKPAVAAADEPPLPGEDGYDEGGTHEQAPESQSGDATERTPSGSADDMEAEDSGAADQGSGGDGAGNTEPPLPDEEPVEGEVEPDPAPAEVEPDPVDVTDAEVIPDEQPEEGGRVEENPAPKPASQAQMKMLHAMLGERGLKGEGRRDQRLHVVSVLVGREVESTSKLTHQEMSGLIDTLAMTKTGQDLHQMVQNIEQEEFKRKGSKS